MQSIYKKATKLAVIHFNIVNIHIMQAASFYGLLIIIKLDIFWKVSQFSKQTGHL